MLVIVVSIEMVVVEPLVEGMEMVRRLGIRVRFSGCMGKGTLVIEFLVWDRTGWIQRSKNLRPQLPRQISPSARLCVVSL